MFQQVPKSRSRTRSVKISCTREPYHGLDNTAKSSLPATLHQRPILNTSESISKTDMVAVLSMLI